MKISLRFVIIFLFLINVKLFSQDDMTLQKAVKIALENNYTIQIAENESKLSAINYSYGLYNLLPQIDLTGRYNNSTQNVQQEFLDGRFLERDGAKSSAYEGTLGLNWTIFDGLQMFINYNKLGELKGIGELKLKSQVETTVRDVSIAFYNLLRLKENLTIVSKNLEISRERFKYVQDRFDVGVAPKGELLQANIDLNADVSDSIDKQMSYDNALVEFERLINLKSDAKFEIVGKFDVTNNYSVDSELSKVNSNTDVMITDKMIGLSEYDIESFKADYYPRLSLYGNLNYNRQESEAGFLRSNTSNGLNYGVNLSFSLFDGMRTSALIENAKVNKMTAELMMKDLVEQIKRAIIITCNNFNTYKELSAFEIQNTRSSEENIDLALESLKLGLMSPIEFREIQRQNLNAQLRLLNTNYNIKINEIELERLTGSIIKN